MDMYSSRHIQQILGRFVSDLYVYMDIIINNHPDSQYSTIKNENGETMHGFVQKYRFL